MLLLLPLLNLSVASLVPPSGVSPPRTGVTHKAQTDPSNTCNVDLNCTEATGIFKRTFPEGHDERSFPHPPSFMQAAKRCMKMIEVSFECFNDAKNHFDALGQVKDHHLAQIPLLAARLNARKIFSESQDKYMSMKSYIKERMSPLDEFQETIVGPFFKFDSSNVTHLDFLTDARATEKLYKSETYPHEKYQRELEKLYETKANKLRYLNVVRKEERPSILDILSVLKIRNRQKRRHEIETLKERIVNVLRYGTYTMDDIILNRDNTAYLWWKYAKPLQAEKPQHHGREHIYERSLWGLWGATNHDDGGASDFVYWLIEEGAPMDDIPILIYYATYLHRNLDQKRFTELVRVWSLYVSGDPTLTLIKVLLQFNFHSSWLKDLSPIQKLLELHKSIGANVRHRHVLFLTGYNLIDPDFQTLESAKAMKQWFVDMGLTETDLRWIKGLEDDHFSEYYTKENMKKLVLEWEEMIKNKTSMDD